MCKVIYKGISTERGMDVDVKDALLFAIWRVLINEEDKKEFVEWFFSGNWIEVESYE